MKNQLKNTIILALKGAAMGIAEVIPGVSGGTIAFISGIYERLLDAIKSIDANLFKLLFTGQWKSFWQKLDGNFLLILASGMLVGLVIGIFGVGYLLEHYPAPLWAFFFGLIIASAIYIYRLVDKWRWIEWMMIIFGFVVAWGITYVSPVEGSSNLLWVFVCGFIAISALILPGVSGSFILLLMGMYTVVRSNAEMLITDQNAGSLFIILAFALGCVAGLMSFARVLSYTFKNFRNPTLAILTGFMLGSLRKIWPWRNPDIYLDKETGVKVAAQDVGPLHEGFKLLTEKNVLPAEYFGDSQILIVILAAIAGFAILFVLEGFGSEKKSVE